MAFTRQHWIYILFPLFIQVETIPTCKYRNKQETEVVCYKTGGIDALQCGLVSDSNRTISISLQGCRLSGVEKESFHNLYKSLKYLDLSQNQINTLQPEVLNGFDQLIYLNLSHNLITELQLGVFDQIPNLDVLDLTENKIKLLKQGIFDPLKKLRHLGLSDNHFQGKDIDPFLFGRNTEIEHIDFSNNDMNDVPDTLLNSLQILEFLNLDRCLLKKVPAFATSHNLKTLKYLILSGNEITKLDSPTTFINLENLKNLNLADNALEEIHADVFKPLKKLKVIVLRGNRIKHLPESLFQNMKTLGNIDLSHNLIETVPVNAFRGTSVKNLNLSNNRFTYLTDNFCLELRNSGAKLTKFYFNQNPWQCACLMSLLNEVKNLEISYNDLYYDGKYPICVTTKDIFCKRHDSFNSVYTDLYDEIVSASNYKWQ